MRYRLADLIAFEQLQQLQESLQSLAGLAWAIVDNQGNVAMARDWPDLCLRYHRAGAQAFPECLETGRGAVAQGEAAGAAVCSSCPQGLCYCAAPLVVEGERIGAVFVGPCFVSPPDRDHFRELARGHRFDEQGYLATVEAVRQCDREELARLLPLTSELAASLSSLALQRRQQRDSDQAFRLLAETSTDLIARLSCPDLTFRYLSPACKQLLGQPPEALLGHQALDYVHPDDLPLAQEAAQRCAEGGPVAFECRFRRGDGSYVWTETNVRSVRGADGGRVEELHSTSRDICARKREEARAAWLTRLLRMLSEANQMVARVDDQGRLLAEVCRLAVVFGGAAYAGVWLPQQEEEGLRLVSDYGAEALAGGLETLACWEEGVSAALEGRRPQFVALAPGEVLQGEAVLALLPLACEDLVQGLLAVLVGDEEPLGEEGRALLGELAVDVSWALAGLEHERRRREAEQVLQLALEGARLGTWDWYIQTGVITVNQRWAEMLGYTAEELRPTRIETWERLVHPDDMPGVRAALDEHLAGRTPAYETEYRIRTRSGEWLWILDSGRVVERAADGTPLRAAGTHLDITGRKHAAEAVLEERQRFQELADLLPLGVFECNLEGLVTYANQAIVEAFGYDMSAAGAGRVFDFVAPAERGAAANYLRAAAAGQADDGAVEYHGVRRDGSIFPLRAHLAPIMRNGEAVGLRGVVTDISDLRRREEQLRYSQERFEKAFHGSPDAILITRLGGGAIVEVNRGFEQMSGYERHNVLGVTTEELRLWVHDDQRDRYFSALREQGELSQAEFQFRVRDGSIIEGLISGHVITLHDTPHVLTTVRDVTSERRAQEALRQSEANYRGIVENLQGAAFFRIGLDGLIALQSPSLSVMLGFDPAESVVGRRSADFWVHPARRETYMAELRSRDGRVAQFETELRRQDGSSIHVILSTSYYRDEAGVPQGTEGMMIDITERVRAEEELRRTQQALAVRNTVAQILLSAPDQAMLGQVLGVVLDALDSQAGLFGYLSPTGDFLAATLRRGAGSPDDFREGIAMPVDRTGPLLQAALQERRTLIANEAQATPEGHPPISRALASPLLNQEEVIGAIYVANREREYDRQDAALLEALAAYIAPVLQARRERDQQERARRAAEEEQRRLESQLQHTQRLESLGVLAAGIAHDFNNILTGIVMGTERAIAEGAAGDNPEARLRQVLVGAERARELVRQILAASAQAPLQQQALRLQDVVNDAVGLARASLPSTVQIISEVSSVALVVLADYTQLHQVILNMCTNAEYAMRPEGGVLTLGATAVDLQEGGVGRAASLQPGRYACITVADTGCGMDAGTAERIFEPFFTTKPSGDGVGMGLATSYGIVAAHGGAITVDSTPGEGTVFRIYLPLLDAVPEEQEQVAEALPAGQGRVVFVEDETAIAAIAAEVLTALGYEPLVFPNAVEALEQFRREPECCDLIVTDQTMPGMKGLDFIAQVRQLGIETPAVLMTGQATPATRQAAAGVGIREVLSKPYGAQELAQAVHRALAGTPAGE